MLEKEKTLEIKAEEYPGAPEDQLGVYKLRRWTWYEKQVCLNRASTVIDATKGLVQTPMPEYNAHMVLITLKEAPFELSGDPEKDVELIKQLDPDIGDLLFDAATELNTVSQVEKEDF
jgi:hypothetical protein